jgi:hypothetical protein
MREFSREVAPAPQRLEIGQVHRDVERGMMVLVVTP